MAKRRNKIDPTVAELDQLSELMEKDAARSGAPAMLPPFAVARGYLGKQKKKISTAKLDQSNNELE